MVGFFETPVIHFESHGFWSSGERGMLSTYQGQNGRRVNFYHEHHNGGEIYIWIGNEAVLADVLSKQSGTFSTKTTYCLNPPKKKIMNISLFCRNYNNTEYKIVFCIFVTKFCVYISIVSNFRTLVKTEISVYTFHGFEYCKKIFFLGSEFM